MLDAEIWPESVSTSGMGCSCSDYRTREGGQFQRLFATEDMGYHESSHTLCSPERGIPPSQALIRSDQSSWLGWGALADWDFVCPFTCQKSQWKATSCAQSSFLMKTRKASPLSSPQREPHCPSRPECAHPGSQAQPQAQLPWQPHTLPWGSPPSHQYQLQSWHQHRRLLRLQSPSTERENVVSEYQFLPLSGFPKLCSSHTTPHPTPLPPLYLHAL